MNIIAFINICALVICAVSLGVIVFMIVRKRIAPAAGIFALIFMGILAFISVSNILEHLAISSFLDEYEGFAGNLFAMFFLLYLYMDSIGRELERRARNERQIQEDLEEKTTLLKEIHHRVKNNLQIVSSLLSLQGSALEDERIHEILKVARDRIISIAAVHEIIYSARNINHLAAAWFLNAIITNLVMSYDPSRRNIEVVRSLDETINIDVDMAISMGLILNELFTNSVKHAFAEGSSGRIEVVLRRTAGAFELRVSDTGAGIDAGARGGKRGIGMDIVRSLVKQVHGEMNIDTGSGTWVSVMFPDAGRAF